MARVVQRRGTPPYMLILFVFLFLVSAILAVLFYVRDSDKAKALTERRDECALLRQKNSKNTTAINGLTMKMTGRAMSAEAAIADAEEVLGLKHAKGNVNLSPAIDALNAKVENLEGQLKKERIATIDLNVAITKKDEEIDRIKNDFLKKSEQAQKDLTDSRTKFQSDLDAKDGQIKDIEAGYKATIEKKDQRITALAAQIDSKNMKIQQLEARIAELLAIIAEYKGQGGKVGELLLTRPSGKIARLLLDENVCYIDRGEMHGVTAGLPFSVFSARTGITEDGKGKAKIIVANVGATTSKCRVVEITGDDPLAEGDLIINIVFNPNRTYSFVIEGEFDLYGTGASDPLANRRVRALIERFGGKVVEAVTVSTDFVVMGDEPPRPPKPAEDAPPVAWRTYNEKMKTYDYYRQVRATAVSLQIPVLNTSRFLAFSGHVPKKRLME